MFVPSKYFLPNLIFAGQELTQKGKSYCAELYQYVPKPVGIIKTSCILLTIDKHPSLYTSNMDKEENYFKTWTHAVCIINFLQL